MILRQELRPELDLHLNLEHLRQMSEGCFEFEQALLRLFVEDSWMHVGILKGAIATHNLRQLEQSAHHLKGSGANVGARLIQHIAANLERQARQQHIPEDSPLLAELENSLCQIESWLESAQV
jgi:HPt (histidine-containing phosphotransfer) domain-containing protein